MNKQQRKDFLTGCIFWGALAVLGLVLLVNPDWAVALAVKLVGWVCLAIGAGLVISMIADRELNRASKWVGAIAAFVLGGIVVAFPLILTDTITRFFGLLLVNVGVQNLRRSLGGFQRAVAIGTMIAGIVLVFVPRTLTHTLLGVAGIVLIIVGAVNLYALWKDTKRIEDGGERPRIIDADE